MFLAQIWGPAILAVGLGVFFSRSYYIRIYRDLEKGAFAALIFGMAAMAAGLAQIQVHNVWDTVPEIMISLLGWGLVLKGAVFTIVPHLADKGGDWAADSKLIPLVGAVMLAIGGYLSYIGYLA
jgi:hypothetical protein